jgi:hypothetical protein
VSRELEADSGKSLTLVIPANAGIQRLPTDARRWMTGFAAVMRFRFAPERRACSLCRLTADIRDMRLILFQRDDCPLCDQALAVLAAAHVPDFESVWIDGDAELETRYGTRVPVLRDEDDDRELDWPFAPGALHTFLYG